MSAPDKQHSGIYTPLHSSQRNVGMKWQRHTSWYISGTVNLERIKNTLLCPWPCNTQYHSRSFSGCESGFYTSHRTATHLSFLQIHKCWIFTNDPSPSTSHQVKRLRTQCTALIYITHIRHFLQKIGFLTFFFNHSLGQCSCSFQDLCRSMAILQQNYKACHIRISCWIGREDRKKIAGWGSDRRKTEKAQLEMSVGCTFWQPRFLASGF